MYFLTLCDKFANGLLAKEIHMAKPRAHAEGCPEEHE